MIARQILEEQKIKQQTTFRNVLREYLQHLFLSRFYQQPGSENFLFKGGTALKLVFGSPRFSEDIDFSALKNSRKYEKILEEVLATFSLENIQAELVESKPTSGGHLMILAFNVFSEKLEIRNEISFRSKQSLKKEKIIVASEVFPAYSVNLLTRETIAAEKIMALLSRQKPRDFFDLYFILRQENLRTWLKLTPAQRNRIAAFLTSTNKKAIEDELKNLLPKSFWPIIRDLPAALKRELD